MINCKAYIFMFMFVLSFGYHTRWTHAETKKLPDSLLYKSEIFYDYLYTTAYDTDSAKLYFERGKDYYLSKNDTSKFLYCSLGLAGIEQDKGNFYYAFDELWDAIAIAQNYSDKYPLSRLKRKLSELYRIFGMNKTALNYLYEAKKICVENNLTEDLFPCNLAIAVTYLELDSTELALQYLDSCSTIEHSKYIDVFAEGNYGIAYYQLGEYKKSYHSLRKVLPSIVSTGNTFQVEVFYHLGLIKLKKFQLDSAVYFFTRSINIIDSLDAKLRSKPEILEKRSEAYELLGQQHLALHDYKSSKQISDSLFNVQNDQYQSLFEINNRYKQDIEEKENVISEQEESIVSGRKSRFRLQLSLGFLLFAALVSGIAIQLRLRIKKMAYQQSLNKKKNDEILEIKNKELTSNALQIIEKEQIVKELLQVLRIKSPETYDQVNRKYSNTNKKIWEDFNLRFSQVNSDFYKRLTKKFPELTQTDLRQCALIKLRFDSKEMSHFLGISVASVHVARSRIRKKFKLKTSEDLGSFLESL